MSDEDKANDLLTVLILWPYVKLLKKKIKQKIGQQSGHKPSVHLTQIQSQNNNVLHTFRDAAQEALNTVAHKHHQGNQGNP